ncbi:MAG: hypothetical protein JOZ80_00985 [Acidobacteriaceae bacterium]|nr:hypothetical protein [Acidobacteriaceae bacterium]
MIRTVKAGLLYFAIVFGVGFLLGPIRLLWLVPRVGTRSAELMEAPIMLVVSMFAAYWTIRWLAVPAIFACRLGMGLLALILMLSAEFSLVLWLRGMSLKQYFATRDPVSGTVYDVVLGIFALIPMFVRLRSDSRKV